MPIARSKLRLSFWHTEPDLSTGIIDYSAWSNFGCYDASKPMTRTRSCVTKYFPCEGIAEPTTETFDCGDCRNLNSGCEYWRGLGYCTHSYVGYMNNNCKFSCGLCPVNG